MKILDIIKKNFKILFRSKASAFVVVAGPLIIIALISLALSNSEGYSITVGVTAAEDGELTQKFISQLEKSEFNIIRYENVERCIEHIKLQTTNICVKLPTDFVVENDKTNEIEFFVDQSRMNIVESIISSVSSTIGIQSDEIKISLTQKLLDTINLASEEVNKEKESIENVKVKVTSIESASNTIKSKGETSSLGEASESLSEAEDETEEINASISTLEEETETLLEDLDKLLDRLEGDEEGGYAGQASKVREKYDLLKEISPQEAGDIKNATQDLEETISTLSETLSSANEDMNLIKEQAVKVKEDISSVQELVFNLENSVKVTREKIDGIQITSAASIVNPFTVKVNPIFSSSNKSIFMFPYFLTLVTLFVGIMLSSTLVVMEKKSRAYFRTFTAPTNDLYHVLGRYITSSLILFSQLSIILGASVFFLKIPLFSNFAVTLLLLFLSVSLFSFLGAVIGHLFQTQEGATIASISIGSLFLFLSNVVLPVESFPAVIRKILSFSPYMLSAELFKESLLFDVSITKISSGVMMLLIYLITAIVLVIVLQKLSYTKFYRGTASRKALLRPHITEENYFKLKDGTLIKDKIDLYKTLKGFSNEDLMNYVSKKNNEFALWIKDVFKDKKLFKGIKKAKSKEEILSVLESCTEIMQDNEKSKNKRLK